MSDPRHESKKPNIGMELIAPFLKRWMGIKLLFLEKLEQRIHDEKDLDKLKALRAELNEILLNDDDIDQLDARLTRITALVEKHKAVLMDIFKEEGRDYP